MTTIYYLSSVHTGKSKTYLVNWLSKSELCFPMFHEQKFIDLLM